MSIMDQQTQADLVAREDAYEAKTVVEKVEFPGVTAMKELKSTEEVASLLALLLKARTNVVEMKYVVGSHVEFTMTR